MHQLTELLDDPVIEPVPVPADCADGFGAAFWRRPDAYLDPTVQAGMSLFAKTDQALLRPGLARLAADLVSGAGTMSTPSYLTLTNSTPATG
jgi:hypothetical protein